MNKYLVVLLLAIVAFAINYYDEDGEMALSNEDENFFGENLFDEDDYAYTTNAPPPKKIVLSDAYNACLTLVGQRFFNAQTAFTYKCDEGSGLVVASSPAAAWCTNPVVGCFALQEPEMNRFQTPFIKFVNNKLMFAQSTCHAAGQTVVNGQCVMKSQLSCLGGYLMQGTSCSKVASTVCPKDAAGVAYFGVCGYHRECPSGFTYAVRQDSCIDRHRFLKKGSCPQGTKMENNNFGCAAPGEIQCQFPAVDKYDANTNRCVHQATAQCTTIGTGTSLFAVKNGQCVAELCEGEWQKLEGETACQRVLKSEKLDLRI